MTKPQTTPTQPIWTAAQMAPQFDRQANIPVGVLADLPASAQRAILDQIGDSVLLAEVAAGRVELAAAVMQAALAPKWMIDGEIIQAIVRKAELAQAQAA